MDPVLGLGLVLLLAVIAMAIVLMQRRRTNKLRSRFGPEYTRTVEAAGNPRKAEAALLDREKRVQKYTIKPLVPGDRERFTAAWRKVQAEFVDDPKGSLGHADALLGDVMAARGYPVSDFEQRSADLSVDHPVVVQNYRAAHHIAVRHAKGEAGTEELRQAMIHYRSLFDELVHEDQNDTLKPAAKETTGDHK